MNWKGFGSCVDLSEVLFHHLSGKAEETHKKPVTIACAYYMESWNTASFGSQITCMHQPLQHDVCDQNELYVEVVKNTHNIKDIVGRVLWELVRHCLHCVTVLMGVLCVVYHSCCSSIFNYVFGSIYIDV